MWFQTYLIGMTVFPEPCRVPDSVRNPLRHQYRPNGDIAVKIVKKVYVS